MTARGEDRSAACPNCGHALAKTNRGWWWCSRCERRMRLKDSVGGSALLTSGVARPASLTPTDTAASVDELRQKLAGWHFAKESLTDGEREILAVAEAVLAELDRRDADGYAR